MSDNENMGTRLQAARKNAGFTQASAAESLGMPTSSYASHENGQNKYDPDQAVIYGRKFKVSPVYLLFGEDFAPASLKQPLVSSYDPDEEEKFDGEGMFVGSVTGVQGIPAGTIPQIDVTAGMGGGGITIVHEGVPGKNGMTFAAEAISDFWRFPVALLRAAGVDPGDLAILPVQGDSMLPTLHDGEFVVVNTKHRLPSPDGIYALNDAFGGVVVKRLELTSKPSDEHHTVKVISDNPRHEPKDWNLQDLRVIGLVLWRFGYIH